MSNNMRIQKPTNFKYKLNKSITKALLKNAMYKHAGEKDFTSEGLDPEDPAATRLYSAQPPVYGPLTPKEQLAQDALQDELHQYNKDIKDVQHMESDHNKAYRDFHTPRNYYKNMGEAYQAIRDGNFDAGAYYSPEGPIGIGNTVFGETVRSLADQDHYYNTDSFKGGFWGPLTKTFNDLGWGGLGDVGTRWVDYVPKVGPWTKRFNPLKIGEMTIPLAIMNHLGQDLGQARGALMNEEGFKEDADTIKGFRDAAYNRKQQALDRRNRTFAEEENWASDNVDDIMYRNAANSRFTEQHMANLAKSDPKEFVRLMHIQRPDIPVKELELYTKSVQEEANSPGMQLMPKPNTDPYLWESTLYDIMSKRRSPGGVGPGYVK